MVQIFKTEEYVWRTFDEKIEYQKMRIRFYIGMGSRSFKNNLVEVIRAQQGWISVWKKRVHKDKNAIMFRQ